MCANFCGCLKFISFHGSSNDKDSFYLLNCISVPNNSVSLQNVIIQNACFEASMKQTKQKQTIKQKANYNLGIENPAPKMLL